MSDIICYGQTIGRDFCQEWYETASRHARKRTAECRKAGFKAFSSSMGNQVTDVGRVKMTLVSIYPDKATDFSDLPPVRVERV